MFFTKNKFQINKILICLYVCFRKTCKNCKCTRNGHEIIAEHGARSRVGFAATLDGLDARSLGYTFAPPGLTSARQVIRSIATLYNYIIRDVHD